MKYYVKDKALAIQFESPEQKQHMIKLIQDMHEDKFLLAFFDDKDMTPAYCEEWLETIKAGKTCPENVNLDAVDLNKKFKQFKDEVATYDVDHMIDVILLAKHEQMEKGSFMATHRLVAVMAAFREKVYKMQSRLDYLEGPG